MEDHGQSRIGRPADRTARDPNAVRIRTAAQAPVDPFGPGGEFDGTVHPRSMLSQVAFDALVAAAEEACSYACVMYNPDEERDPEGPDFVENWLPPIFEGRYDRDFLEAFWYVTQAVAERVRRMRGRPVGLETPAEEIAFYAAFAMRSRIADGRFGCGGVTDANRAAVLREIERYYEGSRIDAGVEALYALRAATSPGDDLARAGLVRLDFERWWPAQ